jgi:hypothetical protein
MNSLIVFIGLIAIASAGVIGSYEKYEEPANYEFQYHVDDDHTKDIKAHSEHASNGAVQGQYWLIDSDGHKRIVDYTADDHHGFQATVRREPTDVKVPIPVAKNYEYKPAYNNQYYH